MLGSVAHYDNVGTIGFELKAGIAAGGVSNISLFSNSFF
jgi:hypothetical protein